MSSNAAGSAPNGYHGHLRPPHRRSPATVPAAIEAMIIKMSDARHSRHLALQEIELRRLLHRLVGAHDEALERVGAERGADRHVGGVAAARHDDAADARHVVAGIEGVPAAAEIDLEPGTEI